VGVETSIYGEAQGPARHHQERQRDVPHLLQVKLAYKELKEVDGLDISKEGVEAWEFAMKRYNKCIDRGGILRVWRPLLTARIRDYKEHLCQERQGQPVGMAPASPSHLSNPPPTSPSTSPPPISTPTSWVSMRNFYPIPPPLLPSNGCKTQPPPEAPETRQASALV